MYIKNGLHLVQKYTDIFVCRYYPCEVQGTDKDDFKHNRFFIVIFSAVS